VLTEVNALIAARPSRAALFQQVCQVIVDDGGLPLAWIGEPDLGTRELRPSAAAGDAKPYAEQAHLSIDDNPRGRGPGGRAWREGQAQVARDFVNNPGLTPWRERAQRFGLMSAGGFPIKVGDETCAVLMVYSRQPDFFDNEQVALLGRPAPSSAWPGAPPKPKPRANRRCTPCARANRASRCCSRPARSA
jgi:GAF domain-containing protein